MTPEEKMALENEWRELNKRLNGEFISPKDVRRMDQITSLLMTDGQSDSIQFKFVKGKESKRVTSFTRDRR